MFHRRHPPDHTYHAGSGRRRRTGEPRQPATIKWPLIGQGRASSAAKRVNIPSLALVASPLRILVLCGVSLRARRDAKRRLTPQVARDRRCDEPLGARHPYVQHRAAADVSDCVQTAILDAALADR